MSKRKRKSSDKADKGGLLDKYSPFTELFKVPATSLKKPVDVFKSYEPKPGECLDYSISQTYVKWNVGETNINLTETHADYVPAPDGFFKKKKKIKYYGAPPINKTVDEIWLEERECLQQKGKEEFNQFRKKRKIADKLRGSCLHKTLLGMVGPDWYQELSPKQLDTVDDLERCILQDYKNQSSINTKENMAALGLVLRPNQQKLEKALDHCCGDPVEFLLTLYQLSNPKRKEYSINDRLILSAVVHLTMTFTLRELHIRIPSPPRKAKIAQEGSKEVKKVKYKSPYLVPYTFKPDPPAHTGDYINKQIQHPESPYFNYLEDLAEEMTQAREKSGRDAMFKKLEGTEIMYEIQAAQNYYNEIHRTSINCILAPTVLVRLDQKETLGDSKDVVDDLKEMRLPAPFARVKGIIFVNAGVAITKLGRVFALQGAFQSSDLDHPMYIYEEEMCACCANAEDDCCKEVEQNIACQSEAPPVEEQQVNEDQEAVTVNNQVPVFDDSLNGDGCICRSKMIIGRSFNNGVLFVNGGIVVSQIGLAYLISSSVVRIEEPEPLRKPRVCCMKGTEDSGCGAAKGGACTCVAQRKAVLRRFQNCYPITYMIGGIVMTEVGPAYMVSSVCVRKEIKKPEEEPDDPEACKCKKEVDRFLKHRCECETCRAQERRDNATYIIAGMKEQDVEAPIPVISGCLSQQKCNCLERYEQKLKRMHEYRQRLEARWRMMAIQQKYAIGGVIQTRRGPVYLITGIRPPVQCACAEMLRIQQEEEEARRKMPDPLPTGRIKYHIQGVRQMKDDQDVYILSQALPVEPCPCEDLYNRFQGAHSICMDEYKNFLSKIKEAHNDWGLGEAWYENDQSIEESSKSKTKKKKKKKYQHATFLSNFNYDGEYATASGKERTSSLSVQTWESVDDKSIDMKYDDHFYVSDEYKTKATVSKGSKQSRSKEKLNKKAGVMGGHSDEIESEGKLIFPNSSESLNYNTTRTEHEEKREKETPVIQKNEPEEAREMKRSPETEPPKCRPDPGDPYNFELTKPKSPCEPEGFTKSPCWESAMSSKETSTSSCSSECTSACPSNVVEEPCCQCGVEAKVKEKPQKPEQPSGFQRYAILKDIPCNEKEQSEIVKKVLEIMAEDGFVLARLPDAYKLPHFKLWMQMRCGKVWMRKDRDKFRLFSITMWGHTRICYKSVDIPTLGIGVREANSTTWKHANAMRKKIAAKNEEFYRSLRRERINSAREFYPTTFSYEFPTRTFRDCYFAYLPAKEEDLVFPTIEQRKIVKRYQCYC